MALTLEDLIEEPTLNLHLCSTLDGSRHPVRWVTITELADPSPWLVGGEVVLTTGLRQRSAAEQVAFVEGVAKAGAVGLGFGTGLSHDTVPKAIGATCTQTGLPLFEVPYATPFIAVTKFIADRITQDHVEQLRTLLRAHDELAHALLSGRGLEALLDVLRSMTGAPAAVVDYHGSVLASSPSRAGWPVEQVLRTLHDAAVTDEPDTRPATPTESGLTVLPVRLEDRVAGALCARSAAEYSDILEYAVRLVGLELARRQAVMAGRRELAGQVVEDIVRATITRSEAERRLAAVGVQAGGTHRVLLGQVATERRLMRALPWNTYRTGGTAAEPVVTAVVDRYFTVVCAEGQPVHDIAHILCEHLQHLSGQAAVGIGGAYSGVDGLRWSFFEARDALGKGPGMHEGEPLSLARLLMANPDLPVQELGQATLAPLRDADPQGHLTQTLRAYLELDGSVQATADELFVHRNTVRYRLGRVEALTGRSLTSTQDRVHLWLALLAITTPDQPL